ncbi:SusC/RagA family TonB-linked outer membrane protein [Niabella sp. CJ426]|uniref:SusC/RagA family TonB-linked outer membrane protein n=1 Tax=Niabella sp. CJ426 TaxID=3393740 RepID=UPI003D029720
MYRRVNQFLTYIITGWILLTIALPAQAQTPATINSVLEGTIVDETTNLPLDGANINIEGTTNQTTTNEKGQFVLRTGQKFPYNIIITFIGYDKKIVLAGGSPVSVRLKPASNELEDVVVVGYGTQKKTDLTGAVSSVSQTAIRQPLSSIDQALKGASSGVQVTQTSGQPGGGVSIRIRGGSSVQGGNEPLYVIDGFPVYNNSNTTGVTRGASVNPLAGINPSDIDRIDILKDAAATAIYGSRGANGVVIITTKKGSPRKGAISYEGSFGIQNVQKKIDVLNAKEFAVLRNEVLFDSRPAGGQFQYLTQQQIDALGEGTNWQNEAFQQAPMQNHQISVSGGSNNTQYFLSGNYNFQEGILKHTDFSRIAIRANVNAKPISKLTISANITASKADANVAPPGIIGSLLIMPPTATIYEPNGSYTLRNPFENIFANPIAALNETQNKLSTIRFLGTGYAEYEVIKGLKAKVLLGTDVNNDKEKYYIPSTIYEGATTGGQASLGNATTYSWLNENTLTYSKEFGKSSLTALVGFTQQESANERFTAGSQAFVTDDLSYNNLESGSVLIRPTSNTFDWVLHSYLSRVSYSYDGLYYLTASIRRDGSSRFGRNNKWGNFPSLSAAWNISNESFFERLQSAISDLKFRASFGTTGNLEIGQYQSLATLYTLNYLLGGNIINGFAPQRIANDNLGWEKTYQYNAGLDLGIWHNRLSFSIDAYYKKTTDLLLNVEIPWTTGYASSLQNFGSVENRGLELGLKSKNIAGHFVWNSDFNISFNRNSVTKIGNNAQSYVSGNYIIQVGKPLGTFYGTVTDGILQTGEETEKGKFTGNATPKAGDRLYKDINGDGTFTTAADRAIIGNAQPDFIFGFINTFSWKGFDLSLFLQGTYGNKIINSNRQTLEMFTGQQNASTAALQRWTPQNPSTTMPRAKLDPAPIFSDRFVEDGSFLRVKDITLSYALPASLLDRIRISSVSFYVTGQNLHTFTRYTGFDPEVTSGNNVSPGTDSGIYPLAKSVVAGLRITL